jgi:putative ABC transport system permease protein
MSAPVIFRLAIQSVLDRRVTAALTVLAVAFSVMLFTGVEKIQKGARTGFEQTIAGTDLIVGARTGPVNLLLYAVFHIGGATSNISWASYQEIAGRPEVAWTVPLSLGDSHRGFRVVGTTQAFFDRYRYGEGRALAFAAGEAFDDVFDAVIGASVARALGYEVGEEIVVAHGLGAASFARHDDKPFTVTGILRPTGTPIDRTVMVSLEGIEAIHIGWESGAPSPLARAVTPERVRGLDLQPSQITAFLVGLESRAAVLRLQRAINNYRAEPLLAIMPGIALAELWRVVGVVERTLVAIGAFVIFVGLLTILTAILTSLNERRREMAILRAVGARPWHIFTLMASEAVAIALAGAVLGLALFYGVAALAAPAIEAQYGIMLTGIAPGLFDLYVLGGVTLAALVLGAFPAWRALRNALEDGLTIRV